MNQQQALLTEDHVVHLCAGRPLHFPHTIVCRSTGREVEQVASCVSSRRALYDVLAPPARIASIAGAIFTRHADAFRKLAE